MDCNALLAFLAGKLVSKIKLPAILGWLIAGMILGPHAVGLLPQEVLDASWYRAVIMWMQCAFGLMLGTELIWRKIKSYGKALMVTTLTQSLGTFVLVSLVFGIVFQIMGVPVYLAFAFGGIALATAPAPALSIVNEFHTKRPVTNTLLPMAVLDDIVGIAVTVIAGCFLNTKVFTNISLNYMLLGVSFSTAFSNMLSEERLEALTADFQPILGICLLGAIVDLGAPLDYHLILGAGLYTFLYIVCRACGKYFGARLGAKWMKMPKPVQKYLGFTLLPHSGVSLVFTGIICATLEGGGESELAVIVKGTIAAAAVINEIIAVIAAKKGFELAGEIGESPKTAHRDPA